MDDESPDKPAGGLLGRLWSRLGPGLVTGAADDDPSGIATHSQIGAQFGFALAWTFVLSFPLMVVIQEVAAEIGSVTGRGIAHNLRRHYSPWLLRAVVTLLLVANIVNLGADLGAMGAALQLLIGGPEQLYTLLFGVVCIVLEVWLSYPRYAAVLKWATLSLFSYVAVVFVADVPWATAIKSLFIPAIDLDGASAMAMVAILGTTISPYLFFWQAGQEVEEQHRHHTKPLCVSPKRAGPELSRIRIDTITGMAFSSLVSLAIAYATAATLHTYGIADIATSAQAAEALRPIAGEFAFALFAMGIIGTGLLAVPVLAGSAAYAVSEVFGWAESLDARPNDARAFYATIAVATLLGAALNFVGFDPVRGALLGGRRQRRAGGAADGRDDAYRPQSEGDGTADGVAGDGDLGLGRDLRDGRSVAGIFHPVIGGGQHPVASVRSSPQPDPARRCDHMIEVGDARIQGLAAVNDAGRNPRGT